MSRAWSELAAETTFEVEADGFTFVCVEPSVLRLTALGVLPPSLVLGDGGKGVRAAASNPVERLLLDEKTQDALLRASILSPKLDEEVPFHALGKHRDAIILAILNRLSGVEAVDAARFPGEAPAGESDRADGEGDGAAA